MCKRKASACEGSSRLESTCTVTSNWEQFGAGSTETTCRSSNRSSPNSPARTRLSVSRTWQHSRRARESFHAIVECKVPVIGAINGSALGAGLAIAASCDMLIACDDTRLGLPEINVGLLGGGRHAMRLFGHSKARRMMFTGQRLGGEELYRLGVVEECVPRDQLMDAAMALAKEIAAKSPIAMELAKHAMNAVEFMSLRDGYRFEQSMTAELSKYDDSKEAMRAFVEKRDPVFQGR